MNSTIFVQPPSVIMVGPIGEVETSIVAPPKSESVAAIIRPVPRDSGKEGSLRIDPANSSPAKTHIRTHQLEDYVNWLRERIEANQTESKSRSADKNSINAELDQIGASEGPVDCEPPIQKMANEKAVDETAAVTAEVADEPGPEVTVTEGKAIEVGVVEIVAAKEATDNSESVAKNSQTSQVVTPEVESTDSLVGDGANPNPSVQLAYSESDSFFSTVAMDNSLIEDLGAQSISTELVRPTNEQSHVSQLGHGYSMRNLQRIDRHDRHETPIPKAHLSFKQEPVSQPAGLDDSVSDETLEQEFVPMSVEDGEAFISTVSKAIASVLTEKSEPEFEEQIRAHFESELHANVMQAMMSRSAQEPVESTVQTEPVVATVPTLSPQMKMEAEKVAAGILQDSRKEIPTYVAAWDVGDFRWPFVTNQMIVSGGKAINQLTRSMFELISADHQRVAITGLGRGQGTSSIAISLARWSAACGKKVLLVDGDIANPTLSSDVGLAENMSWINAVSQNLSPAEVIVRSQKSNLCVMPLSKMVSRVTWPRFIFDSLGELINNVRNHFDLVILDLGPASQLLAELSRPQNLIDTTMFVHDGVASPDFKKTKTRLASFGLNKFVVVQNRARKAATNVA